MMYWISVLVLVTPFFLGEILLYIYIYQGELVILLLSYLNEFIYYINIMLLRVFILESFKFSNPYECDESINYVSLHGIPSVQLSAVSINRVSVYYFFFL